MTSKSSLYYTSSGALISKSNCAVAVESGEIYMSQTVSMDSIPYCRVCTNDNHRTLKLLQAKNVKEFICSRNRNFNNWWNRPDGYSSNSSTDGDKYRQRFMPQGWPFQPEQPKPWQQINHPSLSYRGWGSKRSTVRRWNKGTRTG